MTPIRLILSIIVKIVHFVLPIVIVLGAFAPKKYLIYYIFLWPFACISWKLNNQICFISEWEHYLDNNKNRVPTIQEYAFGDARIMLSKHNIKLSKYFMYCVLIYGGTVCWLIAMYRYFL